MPFNVAAPYTTFLDAEGQLFIQQLGIIYDTRGNSLASVPASKILGASQLGPFSDSLSGMAGGGMYTPGAQTMAALGDSLTALGFLLVATGANFYQNCPLNWGLALIKQQIWIPYGNTSAWSGGPSDLINYSLAVSGKTTVDVINDQVPVARTLKAGWWNVQVGTNDFTFFPTNTVGQICNRLRSIVQSGLAAGAKVCLWTIPPRNDSSGGSNWQTFSGQFVAVGTTVAAQRLKLMSVNAWIRRYAQETAGVVLIDPWNEIVDPASATSDWLSGYSTDAVHFNNSAAFVAGQVFATAVQPFLKPVLHSSIASLDVYSANNNIGGNLTSASGFQGSTAASGTGMTGTWPTGWTVDTTSTATCVATTQARSDTLATGVNANGRELQLAVSTATAGQVRAYSGMAAQIPANSIFCGEMLVSISSNTAAWGGPSCQAYGANASPNVFPAGMVVGDASSIGTGSLPVGATFDAVIRTPLHKNSVSVGQFLLCNMNLINASAATMKIRRIRIGVLDQALPGLILGS